MGEVVRLPTLNVSGTELIELACHGGIGGLGVFVCEMQTRFTPRPIVVVVCGEGMDPQVVEMFDKGATEIVMHNAAVFAGVTVSALKIAHKYSGNLLAVASEAD